MYGWRGSRAAVCLLKMSFMVHYDFEKDSKSTFSKYSFGTEGGDNRKEYSLYVLDNVTILDDPSKHVKSILS